MAWKEKKKRLELAGILEIIEFTQLTLQMKKWSEEEREQSLLDQVRTNSYSLFWDSLWDSRILNFTLNISDFVFFIYWRKCFW